jgi:beta-lactamase class A
MTFQPDRFLLHRVHLVVVFIALIVAPSAFTFAEDSKLSIAQANIQKAISASGADVGIYFKTLDGRAEWFVRADENFHAASTMKVPLMMELFHQVREGKVKLQDRLAIKNEFRSIVDGSLYKLRPEDDSEVDLYQAEGQTRTLGQLCEAMITVSSNLATNLLIEKLGVESIRATVHDFGADGMNLLRGVEDNKAFEKGMNNTTTARGLGILLQAIAEGKAVDAASSKAMVAILECQRFNDGIPGGVPAIIHVAHKTGEISKIHHDAAIVYAERPYILVILVRGIAQEKDSAALIADISRQLYAATQ